MVKQRPASTLDGYLYIPIEDCSVRQILQYLDWSEYTVAEIAGAVGCSVQTALSAIGYLEANGIEFECKRAPVGRPKTKGEANGKRRAKGYGIP